MRATLMAVICSFAVALSAQETFSPAQYQAGEVPPLPALAVGGGQVFLEVTVATDGRVANITPLRTTAPFTELLTQAVREWRFRPAADVGVSGARTTVESKILVAGVFRPPALNLPTLGEAPHEGAPADDDTPYPLTTPLPAFPPQANRGGVVLLETRVDRNGSANDIRVVHASAPFDSAARQALNEWVFRPARVHGAPAASLVYVVIGFAAPVSNGFPSRTLQ